MKTKNRTYCEGCCFWDADEDECGFEMPAPSKIDLDKNMPATRADGVKHTCPCRKPRTYTASYKGRKVQVTCPA